MNDVIRQSAPKPTFRRLRVFALDPGTTASFEIPITNQTTLLVPWEHLEPGPVGEYIAVDDVDLNGKRLHKPVDLDEPALLGQDGLAPSDGDPRFRQQMAYAVAMHTVRSFERALGRMAHWPPFEASDDSADGQRSGGFRQRLNLRPHAMEEANAYYDPADGAVNFGYFLGTDGSSGLETTIFTCLSQDIIAHVLTHALLLGMNVDFEPELSHDSAALHEAFADLVALVQHFQDSDVLRAQIASVRGRLDGPSPLGSVAPQLGQAIGESIGIRNVLGWLDHEGVWQQRKPDPELYRTETQEHDRGTILVAAVFDALKKIYDSRVADLLRLATKGSGVLPEGSLHPDLVNRLTRELSKSATHVLDMCIRALDYLPPVGATFGDFLRAIVTADYDLEPDDPRNYRLAFVEAFRNHGILGADVGTLSPATLLWPRPKSEREASLLSKFVTTLSKEHTYWNLPRDREENWHLLQRKRLELVGVLREIGGQRKRLGGIDLTKPFDVRSIHPRARAGPDRDLSFQWVVKIIQKVIGDNWRASGCTLLVDADTGHIRYLIARSYSARRSRRKQPLLKRSTSSVLAPPASRRLRVFAFDPSMGVQMETAGINEVTLRVPWERNREGADILQPGPVGEYVEVVDRDPSSGGYYAPVDLNDPYVLAEDGMTPSESNPQSHQQMVYAVAMRTIRVFERALGRLALWSPRRTQTGESSGEAKWTEEYVPRLRLYPHALREANAYYSPSKKAVLFGYFPAPMTAHSGGNEAHLTVFTCLSQDIIVHEVTHALLDGMHRRFREPSNPDVLAFHEAFADLVALLQHFSLPEVLLHQIAATRGDLASQNRLGELAQQFGQAIGKRGALRSAIGKKDEATGRWEPLEPDPEAYGHMMEPHKRGAILVAAVFDAFLTIYKTRVADLLRIASEGTGVLPEGHLHPDLVNRLAEEAADSASHVLDMCIRALDYCPPVDITFGDYLRAVVTADFEFDPVDKNQRRVAFVEAFRRHGIVPEDVRTLSVDGLLWRPTSAAPDEDENVVLGLVKDWAADITEWNLTKSRSELFELMKKKRAALHGYLTNLLKKDPWVLSAIGTDKEFEVHSIRPSSRTDGEGRSLFQWVIELTQRIPQMLDPEAEHGADSKPDFYLRGGCTLLVDAETGKIRYGIKKRLDDERQEKQRRYLNDLVNQTLAATYFGGATGEEDEPFAMLHRF